TTLFQARVTPQNSGILNAVTEPFEHANATSTLPMDINLWHKRFCHHSIPNVQKLYKNDLVICLLITSDSKADPSAKGSRPFNPCLAGKMVSGTFPSFTRISTVPLELIHSDLHSPLPVQSSDGFRYWITFIDDCTKLKRLMFLFFFFFKITSPKAQLVFQRLLAIRSLLLHERQDLLLHYV
ncbi:hypothetical protein CPC08DRAFT_810286, partial [Agrocybe pediades]